MSRGCKHCCAFGFLTTISAYSEPSSISSKSCSQVVFLDAANTSAAVFRSNGNSPTVNIAAGTGAGLYVNGDTYATGNVVAYYSSDITLKTNIVPLTNALDKLKTLGGYSYDWIDSLIDKKGGEDGYFVKKHDVGVIAQEVQKVLPECVGTKPDGTLGVQYEKLIPLIIEAIKELDRKIK